MRRVAAILAGLLASGAARAAEVPLPPGAVLAAEETAPFAMASFPAGSWADGPPDEVAAEGAVTRRAWRIPETALSPDELLSPIRDSLEGEGFRVLHSCPDRACGGYDFRFVLDLLPAPAMHVDLGNYRYLLAEAEDTAGRHLVSVVASSGFGAGYIHVTEVESGNGTGPPAEPASGTPETADGQEGSPAPSDLARRLLSAGHTVLDGLDFPSGSSVLTQDRYESLAALAGFLEENTAATVVVVGHTDAVGALDANMALSRARAQSVRARLVEIHGIAPARVAAEGAGALAPVATNLTPEGRAANRRVEAVLLAGP
jgi:OOP family OmpA-OmpF porin